MVGVYLSGVGRGRVCVLVTFGVQVAKFTRSRETAGITVQYLSFAMLKGLNLGLQMRATPLSFYLSSHQGLIMQFRLAWYLYRPSQPPPHSWWPASAS